MTDNTSLMEIEKRLINGMMDYMVADDDDVAAYSQNDINKCESIIDDYIRSVLGAGPANAEILKCVEVTVKELNLLNEECGYELIETDQREDLCAIIIEAARMAGYTFLQEDEDITYEWREW